MLSAVPTQPPAQRPFVASAREDAFRRLVSEAMNEGGSEAYARIVKQYEGDTRGLVARCNGLAHEASETAADKRQYFTMLQQVQMAASHKLWEGAKMSAELATYREIVDTVRRLADRANGEPLLWEDVAAALAVQPAEPVHLPVVLAFQPSDQFRGGQFLADPAGDVTFVFTFIGWALVDHGPGAWGIVEPMFLVEDRAMPKSSIEAERNVRFESYLPHLQRAA